VSDRPLTVKVSEELYRRLKLEAARTDETFQELVDQALRQLLDARDAGRARA
jgi:predicted transcriptional regulator